MPQHICQCRKCETIYKDIDPSFGQRKYLKTSLPELKLVISFTGEPILICPKCRTNEYLIEK